MGHQIDLVIENHGIGVCLDEVHDFGQSLVHQPRTVTDTDDSQCSALPFIKTIHLGDGDIEAASDTIFEALDNPPFTLEGAVASQTQLDAARSDGHR